jgi:hypothetical protein
MRHSLLATVAAVALTAASTLVYAQGTSSGTSGTGGTSAQQSAPGGSSASPSTPHAAPGARSEGTGATAPTGAPGTPTTAPTGAPGTPNGQITETPAPGKATQDRTVPDKQRTGQQSPNAKEPAKQQQGQTNQPGSKQGTSGTAERSGSGGAMSSRDVSLTTEQKSTIRSKVLTGSAPRVTNVNFDVKVGTVVPRSVKIVPVPSTLVEIHPAWRGYMYFVYNDEIIIVEPRTLEIVTVLVV